MRIALDVDGVLANVIKPWLSYNNSIRTNIEMQDVRDWDFWKILDITSSDFYAELNACWKDWLSIPPTEDDLSSAVGNLAELGTVDIVTARDPSTDSFVRKWLAHHKIRYEKYVSVPSGLMKADLDYDAFIDDSPLNAEKFLEKGKRVIVYTQPWNMHLPEDKFVRTPDLAGAIKEIRD
ncbi:MAG: hypothetical protein EB830_02915 [Nitrosopumilus sp. H13]|nr:MAG: hypothetical protein EB830_02915 [Nitrosopumilus sp. H13]